MSFLNFQSVIIISKLKISMYSVHFIKLKDFFWKCMYSCPKKKSLPNDL